MRGHRAARPHLASCQLAGVARHPRPGPARVQKVRHGARAPLTGIQPSPPKASTCHGCAAAEVLAAARHDLAAVPPGRAHLSEPRVVHRSHQERSGHRGPPARLRSVAVPSSALTWRNAATPELQSEPIRALIGDRLALPGFPQMLLRLGPGHRPPPASRPHRAVQPAQSAKAGSGARFCPVTGPRQIGQGGLSHPAHR